MIKKVKVTVCYPVSFEAEINTDKKDFEIREQLYEEADKLYDCSSIDPVILRCDGYEEVEE